MATSPTDFRWSGGRWAIGNFEGKAGSADHVVMDGSSKDAGVAPPVMPFFEPASPE